MDYEQIAQLMEQYKRHFELAGLTTNPDGTQSVKSLPDLIQATAVQLKLSKQYSGVEAEAHMRVAAGYMPVIREELRKVKPEVVAKLEAKKAQQKAAEKPKPAPEKVNKQKESGEKSESDDWVLESAPDVTFDDIVGLEDVKRDIMETLSWPIEHRELMKSIKLEMNNRYLLYGPPGTGKTMIAKAIANFMMKENSRFYAVQCSNLISKYVGDSEKNIKELFEQAAKQERAVIFLDEFDALCPKRSEGENQVNNRIVAELLARTDGIGGKANNTMLIMATNYPWRIDTAMLSRTGNRFYIPLPDKAAREFTFRRQLGHLQMNETVSIESLAEETEGYNHRDINGLCAAIKKNFMRRCIETSPNALLPLDVCDVAAAHEAVRSSTNPAEVREMEAWIKSMQ